MDSIKLDKEALSVLFKISAIFERLNYRYSVIGATAKLFLEDDEMELFQFFKQGLG